MYHYKIVITECYPTNQCKLQFHFFLSQVIGILRCIHGECN